MRLKADQWVWKSAPVPSDKISPPVEAMDTCPGSACIAWRGTSTGEHVRLMQKNVSMNVDQESSDWIYKS